jgi:ubiquinol-cytochrome c reductase cytochrome b/c1 subunit
MKKLSITAAALALTVSAVPAFAAGNAAHPHKEHWSFGGMFGHYDRAQLQRGFKVYREVCSSCHSLQLLSFRNLTEEGGPQFSEGQVKLLASEYKVTDGPNETGEMFERPARLSDRFPAPFANDQAARVSNGGALPPDFSVLAKARTYERGWTNLYIIQDLLTGYQETGVDYIHALLNGYDHQPPADHVVPAGSHYNPFFPGGNIAMPKPLNDGQIEYTDGSPTTVDQYSRDVAAFMMWAAEPHLEARKQIGFMVMIFLAVLAVLVYFTKKKVWSDVAH